MTTTSSRSRRLNICVAAGSFEGAVVNPDCKICLGLGWVCENHPDRAWSQELGCQCGAGMPCRCQGDLDGIDEPDVSRVIEVIDELQKPKTQ